MLQSLDDTQRALASYSLGILRLISDEAWNEVTSQLLGGLQTCLLGWHFLSLASLCPVLEFSLLTTTVSTVTAGNQEGQVFLVVLKPMGLSDASASASEVCAKHSSLDEEL